MYIKKSIKFERPGKYNFEVSGCENIWIDVKLNNNKNLVIGQYIDIQNRTLPALQKNLAKSYIC